MEYFWNIWNIQANGMAFKQQRFLVEFSDFFSLLVSCQHQAEQEWRLAGTPIMSWFGEPGSENVCTEEAQKRTGHKITETQTLCDTNLKILNYYILSLISYNKKNLQEKYSYRFKRCSKLGSINNIILSFLFFFFLFWITIFTVTNEFRRFCCQMDLPRFMRHQLITYFQWLLTIFFIKSIGIFS